MTTWKVKAQDVLPVLKAVCNGMAYDPGHSDLDNEQPITVSMTLGDYRKASRLKWAIESFASSANTTEERVM